MSISLPSREIYAVDVPEITNFEANFQYNFFTTDESVSDVGSVPTKILQRSSSEVDATFIQYATTRAPRFVSFTFKLPKLVDAGNYVSDIQQRNNIFSSNAQNGSLISDNLDKVVTEDNFASNYFVGINFHDGEIDDKLHYQVSGSHATHVQKKPHDPNVSQYKSAQHLSSLTPKHIKPHFLFRALSHPSRANGTRFFDKQGQRIFNDYFNRLKQVAISAQINGKLFHDITNRTIRDPQSSFTTDLHNMHKFSKRLHHHVIQNFSSQISEDDFKTFVPFIDINVNRTAHQYDQRGPEIVGYIIDKSEVIGEDKTQLHDPIIIDNPRVNLTADFQIKYNATYIYAIRTVVMFTLPAIDDDTGTLAMLKVLVSSKPSNVVYVNTIETVAPPPPADLNFTWDYERVNPTTAQTDPISGKPILETGRPGSLLVHWAFPTNSQRDIKKFQVFRRRDIKHPFELVKMYDFDDSAVRFPNREDPDPNLVEYLKSPCTFFYDDDFYEGNHHHHHDSRHGQYGGRERNSWSSTFIYAVAAIDAHGFTSNYSAQYEVWFDPFKNKLEKKLISHSGAPKPYPNLYLEADTFVDTIQVSGPNSKKLKLYFNPEFYHVYDDHERFVSVVSTKQTGGSYKLQFINTDNQKMVTTEIVIDDKISQTNRTLAAPTVTFGKKKQSHLQK